MNFNVPILDELKGCKNLLIAGMGGGFDIFCGLPLYFELTRLGKTVHLANYSFSDLDFDHKATRLSPTLVGVSWGKDSEFSPYFPELYLSEWFCQKQQQDVVIWCFEKTGTTPLRENYRRLVKHLDIDGILLIDGGVDSLVRGDEAQKGTFIEDAISLFAVNELSEIERKWIVCAGLGAEQDISYANIFENIAEITQDGGFLGTCSLTSAMPSYQLYEDAVFHVHGKRFHDPSVINSSIISSVQGHYGDFHLTKKTAGSRLWISPLMSLYWFFDFNCVAKRNMLLSLLDWTETFRDVLARVIEANQFIHPRPAGRVPL